MSTIWSTVKPFRASQARGEAGGHRGMAGSNALVNILKPVNIVNLGNT